MTSEFTLDSDIEHYTEITREEFLHYGILAYHTFDRTEEGHEDDLKYWKYWQSYNLASCECFLLKPERTRLSSTDYREFLKGKELNMLLVECRLGSRERSVIICFPEKKYADWFRLRFQ